MNIGRLSVKWCRHQAEHLTVDTLRREDLNEELRQALSRIARGEVKNAVGDMFEEELSRYRPALIKLVEQSVSCVLTCEEEQEKP